MVALGREVVNRLLLGPGSDGRLVHDSPVRGDVWASFAENLGGRVDLLIEVHWDQATGGVGDRLAKRLYELRKGSPPDRAAFSPHISYLEGFISARMTLCQLAYAVLPFTAWAADMRKVVETSNLDALYALVERQIALLKGPSEVVRPAETVPPAVVRMAATLRIMAALDWAQSNIEGAAGVPLDPVTFFSQISPSAVAQSAQALARRILSHDDGTPKDPESNESDIFSVSRNRPIELAIEKSIPAIKADAVSTLFSITCDKIGWAVLDTGIDAKHPAFADQKKKGRSRVKATYDFTRLREIVLIDYLYNTSLLDSRVAELANQFGFAAEEVRDDLRALATAAQKERPIDWAIAERYILMRDPEEPKNPHGSHVAGILGGLWGESDFKSQGAPVARRGVCPDIRLYDFRVVSDDGDGTEFALMGALQYIRHLNGRNNYPVIHGANISLSIRHDVRNYACGQTPVCNEARRAVESGVVVVVAAGNRGYQSYHLSNGDAFETYAPSSITDPGNAEAVITVGATHRSSPHTYGVSFFSSRGPTGDGRQKPDLVAPGEKIWSVIPGGGEDALSGTSMAAPHVSGAAAMLMARNDEFIGRAAEIKNILCSSCTDLGRERSFQGAGMLDILRAMQRI